MVKKYFLSFFLIATLAAGSTTVQAQTVIGMGTEQPNPNAVLELVPEQGNQGFLAPRLTSAQRQASSFTGKLTSADHGLLVFDVTLGKFFYWFNGAWREGTSGETGGPTPGVSGTTWYTGNAAPDGVDAAEGDFYINESTGEVFKFSGNAFVTMGSIKGGPAANSSNLSSVLQQGSSASNQKITDLGTPTEDNDAATKAYVDSHNDADEQSLENVLTEGNSAGSKQIIQLASPTEEHHATNRKYVDDQDNAVRQYVDSEITSASLPGGNIPSLQQVLTENNSAANQQITNLVAPSAAHHAANRKYVDDRDLENILDRDNNANNNYQIKGLIDPTDPQDAATKNYVDTKSKVSDFVLSGNNLILTEGGVPHTVDVGPLNNGTSAALPAGELFVGNSSGTSQAMKITGDISIDAAGVATITNLIITTDEIADAAVTKEKINANVAGNGLSKNSSTDPLAVKLGNGLAFDNSGAIRIINPETGYLGIGQGTDTNDNIQFRPMLRDGALNAAGELTVKGLQGQPIATTAPSNNEVLQYNGGQWAPTALPPGGGGLPALPNGRLFIGNNGNQPTPTTISGDIAIDANGTATIAADAVDRTKINPNVAGAGLSQAGNGSLRVNLGGDVTTGGGGSNLTVTRLQGNQVATTAPSANGQVLTWDGSQWAPAAPTAGGGGSQQWYAGNNTPNSGNPGGAQDGDYFLRTTNPPGNERVYRKVGGLWQELGGFTSTESVRMPGKQYEYRSPWLYRGSDKPDNTFPDIGEMGDLYFHTGDNLLYIKADDNKWKGL